MRTEQLQWSAGIGWTPTASAPALGPSAQVVFVFGGIEPVAASGGVAFAHNLYPRAHVVGCSTSGEIHGNNVTQDSVSLTAVVFDHTAVATSRAGVPGRDQSYDAGIELARGLPPAGLNAVFVLSEGLRVRGSQLMRGLASVLPPQVTVSGGFASDGDRGARTMVWCDEGAGSSEVVAVGFYGDRLRVRCGATGAWGPFGPDRLVTKARGDVLYELDGRSALSVYKLYLGEHAAHLPFSALLFPLMVKERNSTREVLRAVLSVDEQEESMRLAGDIEEGSQARLMRGSIERLLESTSETARATVAGLAPVDLAILVSCHGRRHVLKQRIEEEVDAVREALGGETAVTGFYSYGEIGPVCAGQPAELHNETMIITALAES